MQKLRFLLLFLAFGLTGQLLTAQDAAIDSTDMRFELQGAPAGWAKLIGMFGEQRYIADSALVDANGHFSLKRKQPLPAGYYYWLLKGGKNFSLLFDVNEQRFAMKGDIDDIIHSKIEGEGKGGISTRMLYESSLFQMNQDTEIKGYLAIMDKNPATSPAYIQARKDKDALLAKRQAFHDDMFAKHPDAFFTTFKIAGKNPKAKEIRKANGDIDTLAQLYDYRAHFWDGVDFNDKRLLGTPVIINKLKRYVLELTPQNPDSIIRYIDPLIQKVLDKPAYFQFFTNWIAMKYENTKTTVMGGESVYVHVLQNYFKPEYAKWDTPENLEKLRKHAWEMEASLLNKKGPDVTAADVVTGEMRSIYALESPIIVVFMYSPDCEHCQKEAPDIERIYKKWKSKGVEFYGIGVNTKSEKLKQFVQEQGFTFPTVFDPTNRAIYAKYFVDITPELYVLNRDRTIIAKNLKPNQLEEVFEREFRKMK